MRVNVIMVKMMVKMQFRIGLVCLLSRAKPINADHRCW
jgi:hypothetical protein